MWDRRTQISIILILLIILGLVITNPHKDKWFKSNNVPTYEELNKALDKRYGEKNGLWFTNPNFDIKNLVISFKDKVVEYSFTVRFHKNFYARLIEADYTAYYKLNVSTELEQYLGFGATELTAFPAFKEGGSLEYEIKIPFKTDKIYTELEQALIKDRSWGILIYDKDKQRQWGFSLHHDVLSDYDRIAEYE